MDRLFTNKMNAAVTFNFLTCVLSFSVVVVAFWRAELKSKTPFIFWQLSLSTSVLSAGMLINPCLNLKSVKHKEKRLIISLPVTLVIFRCFLGTFVLRLSFVKKLRWHLCWLISILWLSGCLLSSSLSVISSHGARPSQPSLKIIHCIHSPTWSLVSRASCGFGWINMWPGGTGIILGFLHGFITSGILNALSFPVFTDFFNGQKHHLMSVRCAPHKCEL